MCTFLHSPITLFNVIFDYSNSVIFCFMAGPHPRTPLVHHSAHSTCRMMYHWGGRMGWTHEKRIATEDRRRSSEEEILIKVCVYFCIHLPFSMSYLIIQILVFYVSWLDPLEEDHDRRLKMAKSRRIPN